jgi:quercetin dioxygenase-like cupin family protein
VQSWDLTKIAAPEGTRSPAVLETVDGARAIVIRLAPGQRLGDHQVRERAWLTVVQGEARIEAGDEVVQARPGTLLTFEPSERHSVESEHGAQIILILSPWAGPRPTPQTPPPGRR